MISQKKIAELDAKFEQVIQDALMEVSDTEFTPDKAAARRKKAAASDLDFCTIYYPRLFDSPFNELHRQVAGWQQGNYTLSGSRRFGKSAFCYVGKVIKHIALGKGGIVNITLYDEDNAKERTAALSRIIRGNKLLCYDWGIEVVQDLKGYHIFKADGGQTTLNASSVRQGLRSIMDDDFDRFKLSIADDLYSKPTLTPNLAEKVYEFIVFEMWGQMEKGGLSITIGNATTEIAPIIKLRTEHTIPAGRHYGLPAMNEAETKSNWPERWSVAELLAFKAELPWDVWMGDYQDRPVEVGDIMDPDWLRFVNINLTEILAAISVADPAHGESPAACDKGLATVGITAKHKILVLDMYLRKEGYELFFDYARQVLAEFGCKVLLFENDFNQWNFADPYYRQWLARTKAPLPIVAFHSSELVTEHRAADKDSRIMNLVHPHQTGQILYNENLERNPDFLAYKNKNYLRFGKHKKDKLDGLDALAGAYIQIWSYLTTGSFKPLGKKQWTTKQMKSWFH